MKNVIYYPLFLLSLTSCSSTYFYSKLDSTSANTWKDDDGYFVTEMDSIDIIHSFKGENAPILITIVNHSMQPLYIDWNRSSVIIDGVANSYSGSIIPLAGSSSSDFDRFTNESYTNSEGTLSLPNDVTFIPPHSKIDYQTLSLTNFGFENIDNKNFKTKTMADKNGNSSNIKALNFSQYDSPLQFRSYLTLYKDPHKSPIIVDEEFYMSNLIKTKNVSPSSMHSTVFDRGDMFYIQIVPNKQF